MKQALIIFVRKPELGKVKTRLAATVGNEKALIIYKELLQHTFDIASATDADKFVFYASEIEKDDRWKAKRFFKEVLSYDDLGAKMKNAFDLVFERGYDKVIIIGSDCFELTASLLNDAFNLLNKKNVTIGPAKDGGYYLLGMKEMFDFLFENKKWSTGTVYSSTVNDLESNNLLYAVLPLLTDVDTEEDWRASKKMTT